jgi:hypothetical protein
MKNREVDPGIWVVQEMYKSMGIDEEWSLRSERGFTWWGHHYAQRVWAEEPFKDQGVLVSKVNAESDFIQYSDPSPMRERILVELMRYASLSGIVVYSKRQCAKLRCSVFVHDQNQQWLSPLFSLASIMQLTDVEMKSEEVAPLIAARPDKSSHPHSGPRSNGDEMLGIFKQLVIPEGKKPLNQVPAEVLEWGAEDLNHRGILATVSDMALTAHIPFEDTNALLQVLGRAEHPGLGNGLLFLLRLLPEKALERQKIDSVQILRMNAHETVATVTGHFLGSWCMDSTNHKTVPVFVTFIPAVLCTPAICLNMIHSTVMHARWAEEYFRVGFN